MNIVLPRAKAWLNQFRRPFRHENLVRKETDKLDMARKILDAMSRQSVHDYLQATLPEDPLTVKPLNASEIEINDSCNLDCVMCQTSKSKRRKGLMDLEIFEKSAEMLARRNLMATTLHTIGDPLANKNLGKYLEILRKHGMHVKSLSTNGLLMRNHIDTIFEYRDVIRQVRPSIDAASKDVYERIRVGGKWENLIEAWTDFADRNSKAQVPYPVSVSNIISSDNYHEIALIPQVFGFLAPPRQFIFGFINSLSPTNDYFLAKNALSGQQVRNVPCDQPFRYMYILKEGTLSLCCRDYHGDVTFGDVEDWAAAGGDIPETAREKILQIRKAHLDGNVDALPPLCQSCYIVDPRLSELLSSVIHFFYEESTKHPLYLQRFLNESLPVLRQGNWAEYGKMLDEFSNRVVA